MMKRAKIIVVMAVAGVIILGLIGCVRKRDSLRDGQIRGRSIEQVFDSHRDSLLSMPGVVGAGIAKLDDIPSIMIIVKEKTPEIERQLPKELDGYAVIIQETGPFKAFDH